MAERFFNIRVGRVPMLVEAQNYLRRTLPPDTVFVDPDQFHVTLVFVEDDKDQPLGESNPAADLPVFGISGFGINSFDTLNRPTPESRRDDGARYAVHVMVDRNPALMFLQHALYYRAQAAGATISRHSFPGRWRPHITMAWTQRDPEWIELPIPINLEVGAFELSGENFTTLNTWTLRTDVSVQEFLSQQDAPITEVSNLAKMLNRKIDRDKRERPDILKAMAQAANVKQGTVEQILSGELTCPTRQRLAGFARALDVKEDTLVRWAREDGCEYPDAQMTTETPFVSVQETAAQVNGRERVDLTFICEMKGKYPDIPLPSDINRDELLAKASKIVGDQAKFVTLPVGQVNAQSRNNRRYLESAMKQFSEQINALRPEGTWGHTPAEAMATEYKPPAIRWLASVIDEHGTVWAKGLPQNKETHDHFELARSANARTGTSLQAWAETKGDDVIGLNLIKLDLADPARVGVPMTAAVPSLSSEMQEGGPDRQQTEGELTGRAEGGEQSETPTSEQVEESTMGEAAEVLALQKDKGVLQETVERQNAELKTLRITAEQIEDIRELFDLPADANLIEHVKQAIARQSELAEENVRLLDESLKSMVAEKVKPEAVRPVVMELVKSQKPTTKRALTKAIDGVLEQDYIKTLLERELQSEMGGNQGTPAGNTNRTQGEAWKKYLSLDPTKQEA